MNSFEEPKSLKSIQIRDLNPKTPEPESPKTPEPESPKSGHLKSQKTPEPESPEPESQKPERQKTPVFIRIANKIGQGTYKTVYSCGITNEDKSLFELPKGTDETKLCIAIVDIIKIIQEKNINNRNFIKLFNEYIAQTAQEKLANKYNESFKNEINRETKLIAKEIHLQKKFFEKKLAPQIYSNFIDNNSSKIYILEEKCGMPLVEYIKLHSDQLEGVQKNIDGTYNYYGVNLTNLPYTDEDVFFKIVNLVNRIAENGYMNTDIKPGNTCTKFDENGLLTNIIALDFDTQYFININLSNTELVENAKIFMLTLFLAHLGKWSNIKFVNEIVVKHLNHEKIKKMLLFFVNNRIVCSNPNHPLLILYHYIIGLNSDTKTSCIDNQSPKKIEEITDKICKYIIIEKKRRKKSFGGSKRSKRVRSSKRVNKSRKSRK
jgi:hypothetical protein